MGKLFVFGFKYILCKRKYFFTVVLLTVVQSSFIRWQLVKYSSILKPLSLWIFFLLEMYTDVTCKIDFIFSVALLIFGLTCKN